MQNLNDNVTDKGFVAIVAGASGPCGREIVANLVNNPECNKVVALARSDIPDPIATFPSIDPDKISSKLVVHIVDWEKTYESKTFVSTLTEKPTVGFCAMDAAVFSEEADFTRPVAFGTAAMTSGVDSMFLISSTGAKTGSWFAYNDTLGRIEDAFKEMGFRRLGIYRPGMVMRFPQESLKHLMPSSLVIDTRDIAKALIDCAFRMKEGVFSFSHDDIKKIAKSSK